MAEKDRLKHIKMRLAVFLDRDGVINKAVIRDGKPYPPATLEEVVFPEGTLEAIQSLKISGYVVIVVTNQPDVAKGVQSKEMVESIHQTIKERFKVDDIKVCYHLDKDDCQCRKPKPGMILAAAQEYSVDLTESYMIGDRWRDIEAGNSAGCKTILIKPEVCYNETQAEGMVTTVNSLYEAAMIILKDNFEKRRNDGHSR